MTEEITVRPYDAEADESGLWELKREFELTLGSGTGGDDKSDAYADKLTSRYRTRWLAWVDRCVDDDPGCVVVADAGGDIQNTDVRGDIQDTNARGGIQDTNARGDIQDTDARGDIQDTDAKGDTQAAGGAQTPGLVGYVFVLPESLSFIWDAAVLNEVYVAPDCRGTGVADILLDAAVEHARSQDLPLDRLVLDVDAENGRAYSFYRRHGFEPWGEMVAKEL